MPCRTPGYAFFWQSCLRKFAGRLDASSDIGIQEVFRRPSADVVRTQAVAEAVSRAFEAGRKVLVLTERTDHVTALSGLVSKCSRPGGQ